MPIYEYRCQSCGHKFERIEPVSDRRERSCPQCGEMAERLISMTSFILKGDGWYVTDHPSPERKKALEAERQATSPTTVEAKKETKETAAVDSSAAKPVGSGQ